MPIKFSPVNFPAADPFVSLEEMRAAHAKLLESFADERSGTPDIVPVVRFLERGAASGISLDSAPTRRAAQGMLDYWTAMVHSLRRPASAEARKEPREKGAAPATHYLLASYDPRTVEELAQVAEGYTNTLAWRDRDLLRRICLNLVRLSPEMHEATLVAVPEEKLLGIGEPGRAAGIVGQLRRLGVLRPVDDPSIANGLALAQDALVRSWPQLRAWTDERRRFRQTVQFWQTHGRDRAALVRGRILEEAHHYSDLDGLENEFLAAAYSDSRKVSRTKTAWIFLLAFLAVAAGVFGLRSRHQAHLLGKQNNEIDKQRGELTENIQRQNGLNAALTSQNIALNTQNAEITRQKEEITKQKDELTLLNADLTRQRGDLEAQRDDLKRQSDKTRSDFVTLLQSIQETMKGPGLTPKQRDGLKELFETVGAKLDVPAFIPAAGVAGTLEPGTGLLVRADGERPVLGTVGFLLRTGDPGGGRFLLGPRYLFASSRRLDLYRAGNPEDAPKPENLIASVPPGVVTAGAASDLVAIELPAGIQTRNAVPSAGPLTGVARDTDLAVGKEVLLVGLGSGTRTGQIRGFDAANGLLLTDRISTNGDAGAPVVTPAGLAVGILVASTGKDESQVAVLDTFLHQNPRWQFVPAANAEQKTPLDGSIVQFIASATQENLIPRLAEAVIPKFRALRISVPDDGILKRHRTPTGKSEVRYYHPADEPLAEEIKEQIKLLLKIDARVSRVNDDSPPKKFIQVSFSVADLKNAFASPPIAKAP